MGKGGYIGGSTVIKTFIISSSSNNGRMKTPAQIEIKNVDKTSKNLQIISSSKAEEKAAQNRERLKGKHIRKTSSQRLTNPKIPERLSNNLKDEAAEKSGASPSPKCKYTSQQVSAYIAQHFPNCPKMAKKAISRRASQAQWTGMSLDECVITSIETYVIFEVCGYLKLVECGISRETAAQLIKSTADAVSKYWNYNKGC